MIFMKYSKRHLKDNLDILLKGLKSLFLNSESNMVDTIYLVFNFSSERYRFRIRESYMVRCVKTHRIKPCFRYLLNLLVKNYRFNKFFFFFLSKKDKTS